MPNTHTEVKQRRVRVEETVRAKPRVHGEVKRTVYAAETAQLCSSHEAKRMVYGEEKLQVYNEVKTPVCSSHGEKRLVYCAGPASFAV